MESWSRQAVKHGQVSADPCSQPHLLAYVDLVCPWRFPLLPSAPPAPCFPSSRPPCCLALGHFPSCSHRPQHAICMTPPAYPSLPVAGLLHLASPACARAIRMALLPVATSHPTPPLLQGFIPELQLPEMGIWGFILGSAVIGTSQVGCRVWAHRG